MAMYRKEKFTSLKKVDGPEIWATHKSQKVGGPRPPGPVGSTANDGLAEMVLWFMPCRCQVCGLGLAVLQWSDVRGCV